MITSLVISFVSLFISIAIVMAIFQGFPRFVAWVVALSGIFMVSIHPSLVFIMPIASIPLFKKANVINEEKRKALWMERQQKPWNF